MYYYTSYTLLEHDVGSLSVISHDLCMNMLSNRSRIIIYQCD